MRCDASFFAAVVLAVAVAGCNQSTAPITGTISGVVTSGTLGPQAGVQMTLSRGNPQSALRETVTDNQGSFTFSAVPAGDWVVAPAPATLALGCLTPASRPLYLNGSGVTDASFELVYVPIPGVYAGTITAVTQGAISDTLAARGMQFFATHPVDVQMTLTATSEPHQLAIVFDTGVRGMTGTCIIHGSSAGTFRLAGSEVVPGVGELDYSSVPPVVYPTVATPPDSVLVTDNAGHARLSGRLSTHWHLTQVLTDFRQDVVLHFDVTRTTP
jgi:hypothetical protein